MSAELLEFLRFGTAILAGGIVAVIAQRLAFDHAKKLAAEARTHEEAAQREERTRRRRELLALLRAEISEAILTLEAGRQVPLSRSAWDAARGLPLPAPAFAAVAAAYQAIAGYNAQVNVVETQFALNVHVAADLVNGPDLAKPLQALRTARAAIDAVAVEVLAVDETR